MKYKLTNKHFQIFKKECRKWIDLFGLKGYDYTIKWGDLSDCYADCSYNVVQRWAVIRLMKTWGRKITSIELKQSAFHEVCHILFGIINVLAKSRFIGEEEVDEEIHNLIRIFENTIFKQRI